MADILFIYNDCSAHSHYSTGLGVASISAYLRRHGFTTDLIYHKTELSADAMVERVRRADPLAVGFYGPSSGFWAVLRLSALIRTSFPRIFQVYGGPQATLRPEILAASPDLDAVCVGLGEEPVLHLLERLRGGGDVARIPGFWVASSTGAKRVIQRNPPQELPDDADSILDYDYGLFLKELESFDDFDRAQYNLEIMLSRGCPFSCAFCSNRALRKAQGGRILRPSVGASIALLQRALAVTGLKRIEFHDEILVSDKVWFREFIARYAEEVAVPFWCNLRAGTFDEEDVRALKAAGVERVFLGLESGNDALRTVVMRKTITREQLGDSVLWLKRHEVPVVTQNMIGVPSETPGMFLDTIRLNATLRPDFMILSVYFPYPGTELEQACREQGLLPESERSGVVDRLDTILRLPGFSRRDILFYQRHFAQFVKYERLRLTRRGALLPPLSERAARPLAALLDAWRAYRLARNWLHSRIS
jgi:anaerobic magnesium-protoporphyrin IX monomethyl ester cyclase